MWRKSSSHESITNPHVNCNSGVIITQKITFIRQVFVSRSIALRMIIWTDQMMSFEWIKFVATELLVRRMSKPFAAKSAANWIMKKWILRGP